MNKLSNFFLNNINSLFLCFPVVFGVGIIVYFALSFEPLIPHNIILLSISILSLIKIYSVRSNIKFNIYVILMTLLLFVSGFLYAFSYAHLIKKTGLEYYVKNTEITGIVKSYDFSNNHQMIILLNDTKIISKPNLLPLTIKLYGEFAQFPNIGDTIRVLANVSVPSDADVPGSFDFARWSFFNKIDGNAFATSDLKVVIHENGINLNKIINNLRLYIHNKVYKISNSIGQLIDALVLGFSKSINSETNQNYKSAGISHILSISGFHMAIIGGWLFAIFLFIIKLFPFITKRIPASKLAIFPAFICLFIYLLISGTKIPSLRAFSVVGLSYIALLFDRTVFSLRNCMIIFFLILLINPHNILDASFQMSFSAVIALIYFYNKYPIKKSVKSFSIIYKILSYVWIFIKTTLFTTFVASLATAPFVAYHFKNIYIYSIIGNLLCLPFFIFIILPFAFLGTIVFILTGIKFPLIIMDKSSDIVNSIISLIHSFPLSQISISNIPGISLFLIAIGMLTYMFFSTKIRFIGIYTIIIAIIFIFFDQKPIIYSSPNAEVIAVMTDSGKLRFNKKSSMNYPSVFKTWNNFNGDDIPNKNMMGSFKKGFDGNYYRLKCENKICIYSTPVLKVAFAIKFVELYRNIDSLCNYDLDYIISAFGVKQKNCNVPLLTPKQVGNSGFVIYKDGKIKVVNSNRYWSPKYRIHN